MKRGEEEVEEEHKGGAERTFDGQTFFTFESSITLFFTLHVIRGLDVSRL